MNPSLIAAAVLLGVLASSGTEHELEATAPPAGPPEPPNPDIMGGLELARAGGRRACLEALARGWLNALWCPIVIGPYRLSVLSDAVAFGHPSLRWSPTQLDAQSIADACGALLPTPAIVDATWQQAAMHLEPHPRQFADGPLMMSVDEWIAYAASVEFDAGPAPCAQLIAPLGKDYVMVPALRTRPNQCAIYGWHRLDGRPIQPVFLEHEATYADYSHAPRVVSRHVERDDGEIIDLADLYEGGDAWIAPLGPTPARHPGNILEA